MGEYYRGGAVWRRLEGQGLAQSIREKAKNTSGGEEDRPSERDDGSTGTFGCAQKGGRRPGTCLTEEQTGCKRKSPPRPGHIGLLDRAENSAQRGRGCAARRPDAKWENGGLCVHCAPRKTPT